MDEILNDVKYFPQETPVYCGAACAQMLLSSRPVGLSGLDQTGLFSDFENTTNDASVPWGMAPDELRALVNYHIARSATPDLTRFQYLTADDERYLTYMAARGVLGKAKAKDRAPVVALVYGGMHWVIVYGYSVGDGANAGDWSMWNNDSVAGVFVADPWWPSATDQPCAQHIWRAFWHCFYALPIRKYPNPRRPGLWADKHVALLQWDPQDPLPAPLAGGTDLDCEDLLPKLDLYPGTQAPMPPEPFHTDQNTGYWKIDFPTVLPLLKNFRLDTIEPWKSRLQGIPNSANLRAAAIERLDMPGHYYVIVYIRASDADSAALAVIFTKTRQRGQSGIVYGQSIAAGSNDAVVAPLPSVPPDANTRLVWAPCLESFSPFYPFYEVNKNGRKIYVRVDNPDRQYKGLTMSSVWGY